MCVCVRERKGESGGRGGGAQSEETSLSAVALQDEMRSDRNDIYIYTAINNQK